MTTDTQQNISEILQLFEAQLLQETIEQFHELLNEDITLEDLEELAANDKTTTVPTIVDAANELLKSNYSTETILREAKTIGTQHKHLKEELEYYCDLLNEPKNI
ncbi:Uncharacterized protein QTN25_010842 [Entamoeba marina]